MLESYPYTHTLKLEIKKIGAKRTRSLARALSYAINEQDTYYFYYEYKMHVLSVYVWKSVCVCLDWNRFAIDDDCIVASEIL